MSQMRRIKKLCAELQFAINQVRGNDVYGNPYYKLMVLDRTSYPNSGVLAWFEYHNSEERPDTLSDCINWLESQLEADFDSRLG